MGKTTVLCLLPLLIVLSPCIASDAKGLRMWDPAPFFRVVSGDGKELTLGVNTLLTLGFGLNTLFYYGVSITDLALVLYVPHGNFLL